MKNKKNKIQVEAISLGIAAGVSLAIIIRIIYLGGASFLDAVELAFAFEMLVLALYIHYGYNNN
jgi:hypothetical protein